MYLNWGLNKDGSMEHFLWDIQPTLYIEYLGDDLVEGVSGKLLVDGYITNSFKVIRPYMHGNSIA